MQKKGLLLITLLFLIPFISWSQTTSIPDNNFEAYLETHDSNLNVVALGNANSMGDGILNNTVPTNKIDVISDLDIINLNIANLSGVEDFISLTNLDCSQNQLTSLDVTSLSNLKILWCFSNNLSNIDITQNTDLISLRVEDNALINLDVSNNTKLNVLACEQNQIVTLNVSNNTSLSRLQCGNNLLTNLDVSVNTNLSYLSCEQNEIPFLNLENHNRLGVLLCNNNELTTLNLSRNPELSQLNCSNNDLCSLNIKNGNNNNLILINFDMNTDLNCVVVDDSNGNHSTWIPSSFSNYVNAFDDCGLNIPVDALNSFIGPSYTLPTLINGNYFTASGGNGINLNAGDIISTSQTIYIYNETVCANNESTFNILITENPYFIPKYFTPNNDGNHDYWKVFDTTNSVQSILIFDRFGKLLKDLNPSSEGWNGTFNGELLPNDDYWYRIIFNSGELLKGHFTLKR